MARIVTRPAASRDTVAGATGGGGPSIRMRGAMAEVPPVRAAFAAGAASGAGAGRGAAGSIAIPGAAGAVGRGGSAVPGSRAATRGAPLRTSGSAGRRSAARRSWSANSSAVAPSRIEVRTTVPPAVSMTRAVIRKRSPCRW